MKNIFYTIIALLLSVSAIKAQDTSGTDFWVTFGYNPQGGKSEPALQIRIVSGDNPTTGNIYFTHLGTSLSINIPPQDVMTYTLTGDEIEAALNIEEGQSNFSVHITTDHPVMAYVMNQNNKSTDATNLLPVTVLGTDYYHISYMPYSPYLDAYAVIATDNNTTVFHNGTPLATLNTGQLYYKISTSDMTGVRITSNKPIAFIAMNQGPQIPEGYGFPDCLMQQLAPIETWGKTFFVPVTIKGNDVVRIVASQNSTNITTLTGGTIRSASGSQMSLNNLQAGQFVEIDILLSSNGCYIEADKPVGVCTYMTVPEYIIGGGSLGDPSQCWISGIAQSVSKALVSAFVPAGYNTEIDSHYALIITPTATKNNTLVSIGGAPPVPLSGGVWHDNATAGMSFYDMLFPTNNLNIPYTFTNDNGLVIMCYGLGDYESYYYLASSAMRNLSAAFTANGIPYSLMSGHFFCEDEINFIANVEGINPNPGSLNWYIDNVHQPALTDQLTWSQTFPIGNYAIKMTVLFEDETTEVYEGVLNIILCDECLELYATGVFSDGFFELEWQWLPPAPTGDYTFTLYQWDEILGYWQTVSTNCDKTIKVLNVYPNIAGSNTLQEWMNDPEIGFGKIIVTPVTITNFNANPDLYLKNGGEYIHDVVMFGSWDDNNGTDLTPASAAAVETFLNSGRGVLFGHDTQHWNKNFASLAHYINMDILENNVGYFRGSERIKVVNNGFLLKYPHHIPYGDTLDIPCTHTSGQFAKGIVWMNFPEPQQGPCFHAPIIELPNGGTNDFYLTTWNNAAMIQTGHSSGESTFDERKVIANTLWYLSQLTTETSAKICSAPDLAAPDTPTVNRLNCNQIEIQSKDNGSLYRFYVKATNVINYADTCISNVLEVINKSGLKGFYILEDNNPAGIPEASNPATVFMAAIDDEWITYLVQSMTKYIHIQAIDSVGNLSEVVTLEPLEECNCDPIPDFIVLQPREGGVMFIWNEPENPDFIGIRIIRDGVIIASLVKPPTFSYTDYVSVGAHYYCLIGLYNHPDCMESTVCHLIDVYEQCDPVIEVSATVIGADKVQISWMMPFEDLGFVDYALYCDNILLINTNQTLYIHEGVTLGEHIYSVVANYQKPTEDCTESEPVYSEPVFIETCVMVENVTVTETTKEHITITWTATDDVETFNVYRDNKFIANVNETACTDSGVFSENVVYHYCVIPVYHTCQVSPTCAEAYMEPCIPFNVTNVIATGNKETKTAYIIWDYVGADATFNVFKNNILIGNTANKNYTDNIEYDFIYKYCVTPLAECLGGATSCDTVLIDTPTGITDWKTGLTIYPNPTDGELHIRYEMCDNEICDIEIYDLMGCRVMYIAHPSLRGGLGRLDVSRLPAGMYFIKIGDKTVKFVKE